MDRDFFPRTWLHNPIKKDPVDYISLLDCQLDADVWW